MFSTSQGRPCHSRLDSGFSAQGQRLSPLPMSPVVTVRKKRSRLRNVDSILPHTTQTSTWTLMPPPISRHSSTSLTPRLSTSSEGYRRTVSARPISISSRTTEARLNIMRQSSLKHRMLNRLASGLLPLESTAVNRHPSSLPSDLPTVLRPSRPKVAKAVMNIHQAEISSNNSVLFSVDVGCCVDSDGDWPLLAAVLIDNSLYSSPTSLLASCETTMSIASRLNLPQDRFSLYCSCPRPSRPLLAYVGNHQLRDLQAVLDSVEVEPTRPPANYLRRASEAAAAGWTPTTETHADLPPASQCSGHLFVLTPNPFALDRLPPINNFQVHVICSGSIPWSLPQKHENNGWFIINRCLPTPMLPSRSTGQELDLDVQIQSLMDNVRSGRIPDQLQNVCVSLHPSPQTTIERVIGLTRFRSLSAGEFKTIIVKVRLADAATAPALLSGFPRGLRTPSGNVDVEGELAAALSEKIIQAFDVQLNYEHTALPPGTACTIGREVRLRQAEDGRSVSNISDVASVQHESQIVQARLAFHIALSQNARQGLNSMKAQFPAKATHGLLSDYVQAITQELKYQARILERFDSVPARSARSSISPEQRPSSRSPCGSVLRRPVNAQRSVEAGLNLQAFPHPPLPLRLRRNGARDSSDEARRIWAALRVRKGHVGNSANDQELRQAWSSDTLRQIKQTAENNRRSIGSDTLKSLRYETLQENVAPWL